MKIIEINNLTKFYGKSLGIQNVSFNVEQGEVFGFIGPNGAGKSTTIRTLLNFLFPSSGSGKIFGFDIVKETKKIKEKIGYVPAEVNYYNKMKVQELFDYSARFFGLKDYQKRVNEYSELLELDLSRVILDLSSGNKKKVSIVQALLHKPELLILDEPTSGLDPLVQSSFFDLLNEESKSGTTIFFSSHVLSEVQKMCDRVGIIRKGSMVKVETIENLKHNLLKHVKISFDGEINSIEKLSGVVNPSSNGSRFEFLYDGDIKELLSQLSDLNIIDLSIEDPSLDEIFIHFYSGKEIK